MGFEAQAFERAEDFLRSHQITRADCLITDVRMPGMSGLELLDRLLAAGKSLPAIVLTRFYAGGGSCACSGRGRRLLYVQTCPRKRANTRNQS